MIGGGNHACAISGLSPFIKVTCWGDNSEYTTLGSRWFSTGHPTAVSVYENSTPNFFTFPLTGTGSIPAFTKGDIGYNHNCVIGNSGADTGKVFCWGGNQSDQTRGIAGLHTATPVQVNLNAGTITNAALKVAAGGVQTCAIVKPSNAPTAQKVMCWSSNPVLTGTSPTPLPYTSYTLGVAPFPYAREITSQAEITDAADISSGSYGNCMTRSTKNNGIWCWGHSVKYGSGYVNPVQAPLDMNVKKMTLGAWHSCALIASGKVYCFGTNNHGQLGNGNNVNNNNHAAPLTQVIFPAGTVIKNISTKHSHTCAIAGVPTALTGAAKDTVWCWGNNQHNELGDCSVASVGKNIPVQVMKSCSPPPQTTNGACGTANGAPSSTAPTANLCSPGTASLVAASGINWAWTCAGTGGGTTASCATNNPPSKGVCGTANGASFPYSPGPNPATAPRMNGHASCSGTPSINCMAREDVTASPVNGVCGPGSGSPVDASIAAIPTPYCSAGTPSPSVLVATGTWVPWSCVGANGGTTASCGTKILPQQQQFTVTPIASADCSISPNTSQTVTAGNAASFTITPNTGYMLSPTTGTCGGSMASGIFTTSPVINNCTVIANCRLCNKTEILNGTCPIFTNPNHNPT